MKKLRSDSAFASLTIDQREELAQWLLTDSLDDICERLAKPAPEGMNVQTSRSSLHRYALQIMPEYMAEQRRTSLAKARHLKGVIANEPNEFSEPTFDALEQRVFEMSLNPKTNPEALYKLYRLILRANDQKFSREKFEFRAADAIVKNFDKIAALIPKKPVDPRQARRARDQVRFEVFGCLTDAEEPLGSEETSAHFTTPSPGGEGVRTADPSPNRVTEQVPPADWVEWRKNPSKPYDPCPNSTIGNAVIMGPEELHPKPEPEYDPFPSAPQTLILNDRRDYKNKVGRDYFGEYVIINYTDGNNEPHGEAKYVVNPDTGVYHKRKEQ